MHIPAFSWSNKKHPARPGESQVSVMRHNGGLCRQGMQTATQEWGRPGGMHHATEREAAEELSQLPRRMALTVKSLGSDESSSLLFMESMMHIQRLMRAALSFSWPGGMSALLKPGIMDITCAEGQGSEQIMTEHRLS